MQLDDEEHVPHISEVFPTLPVEKYDEAVANIRAYLELALRVYERIRSDPTEYARFKTLTRERGARNIQDVDSTNPNSPQPQ